MNHRILYLSYDGMTDPLGQSQVLPYLMELSKHNYTYTIISAEKENAYRMNSVGVKQILDYAGIEWHPFFYRKSPPILSTIIDVLSIRRKAQALIKGQNYSIVHCRSYITALVGHYLKNKYGIKFIFDMRGLYADERVDGNLWNLSNPVFKLIYRWFKIKEREFLLKADYTICLTESGKKIIGKMEGIFPKELDIQVISCCVDIVHFNPQNVSKAELYLKKKKLKITDDDFVITYIGSLGTWYMMKEMVEFFQCLYIRKKNSRFLIITKDDATLLLKHSLGVGIPSDRIIVASSDRNEVPLHILLGDVSLFFIQPVFSKKASSPTKYAEILAMGKPVICNNNIGDLDSFQSMVHPGALITRFDSQEYNKVIDQIESICSVSPQSLRDIACEHFSLELGVKLYQSVYRKLI